MTTVGWLKDVLLFCVAFSSAAAIAAFLLAPDRVKEPASFQPRSARFNNVSNVAKRLDRAVEENLRVRNLAKAPPANATQIVRRLALALTGTLPSLEELRKLDSVEEGDRVHWYVSHLLEDKRSSDYLAERFAKVFIGVEEGPFLVYRRRRFVSWLSDQLSNKVPYNQISRRILTSKGLWTDSPEVNFYTYNIVPDQEDETKPDPIRLAARTSRAFLGMRIDCLQCHDDFLGTMNLGSEFELEEGTQRHFHALASFFSQVQNSLVGVNDNLDAPQYEYQLLHEDAPEIIIPHAPFNTKYDLDSEIDLRTRLANWVTHPENRPYARAIVNRIWAIMFGRSYMRPVDDIPLEGPFPAGMEILVNEFITSNYDLQHLIRVIAASETFQRSSSADFEIQSQHFSHFAVFPITRLRPEQVAGSIIQSTSLKTIDSTSHVIARLVKYGQQNDFVARFGDLGEDEYNDRSETITQRLLMMNGELVNERLTGGLNSTTRIALLAPDNKTAIETVYIATLARKPSSEESIYFIEQLEDLDGDDRNKKISDIYWALINSVEFVWNH